MDDEIEDAAGNSADEVESDVEQNDAVDSSVYEAKIAELSAAIETHLATISRLKAHNYDLISAQTREKADDTGVINDAEDTPDDITIDDLFKNGDDD